MPLFVAANTGVGHLYGCDYFGTAAYLQRLEDQNAAKKLRELEQNISDTRYLDDVLND